MTAPEPSNQAAPGACLSENPNRLVAAWYRAMATVAKKFPSGEIDRAGKVLISDSATDEQIENAFQVMDNWRLSHSYPLEIARNTLQSRTQLINPRATTGTRLKREESIRTKLVREPKMQLSTMQDIGGCRVILQNMQQVNSLIDLYAKDADVKITDYVDRPRVSGYRGKHVIVRFKSQNEHDACYHNMRIELQIRTELQHSWATAVEVASTFTQQNLKSDHPEFSDERWVRFFALMGSAMALEEGGGLVKDTPTDRAELVKELRSLAAALKVIEVMRRWNTATEITDAASSSQAHQFLIELQAFDHFRSRVNVTAYDKGRERQAAEDRVRKEMESRTKMGVQVVLVGVESVRTLKTAYPNYFSDTSRFLRELDILLHGRKVAPYDTPVMP